jgi:hypothetical protein
MSRIAWRTLDLISDLAEKTSTIGNDIVLLEDSEDLNNRKRVKLSNLSPSTYGVLVEMEVVNSPTYHTAQHVQDIFHSSGRTSGGILTENGGNVNISAGTGLIRVNNDSLDTLLFFDWESGSFAVPTDTTRYVGLEYNGGNPQLTLRSVEDWNYHNDFPLGAVVNEAGTLYIFQRGHNVGDHASAMIQRLFDTNKIVRDNTTGGLVLGESGDGNRYVTMSLGNLWTKLNKYNIESVNTGTGHNFDRYYRKAGGGFNIETNQTTWNNSQYDNDSGTLATISGNKYAVQWFYIGLHGGMVSVYGRGEYPNLSSALAESIPATVPDRIVNGCLLIGRIVFQNGGSVALSVESAFEKVFNATGATDHGDLSGLSDDDHPQYFLADGSRSMSGNIYKNIATGLLHLAGGTSITNGANIELYGGSHSTLANDAIYDADEHTVRSQSGGTTYLVANSTGVGVGKAPGAKLDVNGNMFVGVSTASTNASIELGISSSGDRAAFIDFHSNDTHTDYASRIIRGAGVDGDFNISSKGVGGIKLIAEDAGTVVLATANTARFTVSAAGGLIHHNVLGLYRNVDTSYLHISGGSSVSNGANIELYGGTHASLANRAYYDADLHTLRSQSGSVTELTVGGGILVGSASGGLKGAGTVNASAVYDDNILILAPDYVFDDPEYRHLSVNEVMKVIENEKHLPWCSGRDSLSDMPVGRRINQVLEAVENLMLYIAQQQNDIIQLREEVTALKGIQLK